MYLLLEPVQHIELDPAIKGQPAVTVECLIPRVLVIPFHFLKTNEKEPVSYVVYSAFFNPKTMSLVSLVL